MREFRYSALTSTGHTVSGVRRAQSADVLSTELLQQGLVLLKSRPTLGSLGGIFSASQRAAGRELRDFTQHMATCLGAGIPAMTALSDYQADTVGAFAEVLTDIRGDVSSGTQLDESLGRFFARIVQNLVREAGMEMRDIRAIGSHGQNVWHQPWGEHPVSLQLGRPDLIAGFRRALMLNAGVLLGDQRWMPASGSTGRPRLAWTLDTATR